MRTKTLDDNTEASHPGNVLLSHAKLERLQPELFSITKWLGFLARNPSAMFAAVERSYWKTHIEEHLMYGDGRAALVVSTSPLLISAYTDEIDCVALLRFESSLVSEYGLIVGSRLLTVNTYSSFEKSYEEDLTAGPGAERLYGNFSPFIAEFLTDELAETEQRKTQIQESEWLRTEKLSSEYLSRSYAKARDGRPLLSILPANLPMTTYP